MYREEQSVGGEKGNLNPQDRIPLTETHLCKRPDGA